MVFFFFLRKGKFLAMQFSRILLKGRSHHTIPHRLRSATAKAFPRSHPTPTIHHSKGEVAVPSSDFLPSAHQEDYGHSSPVLCKAFGSARQAPSVARWAKVGGQDAHGNVSGSPLPFAH